MKEIHFVCSCGNIARELDTRTAQFRQCDHCGYHAKVWLEDGQWLRKWWTNSFNRDGGLYSS